MPSASCRPAATGWCRLAACPSSPKAQSSRIEGAIDTLLVAGTPAYAQAYTSTDLHAWLRHRAPQARRYGSVCTGAFFLGAAGLLDGLSATTHWQHAAELAEKFPAARIEPDRIYVEDGALWTSAGVTAGIDLALKLIEVDHGRELALAVARRLVVFLKRPGGQSQFSAHLAAQIAPEGRIQTVQHWVLEHLPLELTVNALASRAGMSVRNFTRVFLQEAGTHAGRFRRNRPCRTPHGACSRTPTRPCSGWLRDAALPTPTRCGAPFCAVSAPVPANIVSDSGGREEKATFCEQKVAKKLC